MNGGSRITDYKVEYSADAGLTWSAVAKNVSSSTILTVRSLYATTNYLVRVAAQNTIGIGPSSLTLSGKLP